MKATFKAFQFLISFYEVVESIKTRDLLPVVTIISSFLILLTLFFIFLHFHLFAPSFPSSTENSSSLLSFFNLLYLFPPFIASFLHLFCPVFLLSFVASLFFLQCLHFLSLTGTKENIFPCPVFFLVFMPFSCSDWARFLLLSGFCFLSQFSSVDLKTLQPTIECSMHRKESSLLLCLHFLSYPLTPLCLSQGSVFVPWVTHKTVKVSWRWPVMCLCLSISGWSCLNGSHYWFTLPSSTDTHTHTHTQAGFWLPGLLVKHWAGCWGLQMSYYIRCVHQMPVYTFSCPLLSLSFSFLPASNKSVCVSADLCPPIIFSLAS